MINWIFILSNDTKIYVNILLLAGAGASSADEESSDEDSFFFGAAFLAFLAFRATTCFFTGSSSDEESKIWISETGTSDNPNTFNFNKKLVKLKKMN